MSEPVRVLMSEGSSLSARESLLALGAAGCRVEVVDGDPLCLARFSRHCARVHPAPRFGVDPGGYLDAVRALLRARRFDVLYPAHEQAYLFARARGALSAHAALALPDFARFEQLQSKVGFAAALDALAIPGAPTEVVRDEAALRRAARPLPVYVKAAFGTASRSTFCVRDDDDLARALDAVRAVLADGVLVQRPVDGVLHRAQAVFDDGRLVALHACAQRQEGVGGGDVAKESVDASSVRGPIARLGAHLAWRGGLSLDYLVDAAGTARFIDANPRLAETGNALAAGVNLPALLVDVSLGRAPTTSVTARVGVRTHMAIQAMLRAARDEGTRRGVARAMVDLARRRGLFARSVEELTPTTGDARAAVPLAAVGGALLARPSRWRALSSAAVEAYAATPAVVAFVRGAA